MDRFVVALSTGSLPHALAARARLEDEGIPVLMKGEGDGPYRMGPVHLLVPEGLIVQARLVLEDVD
ncbi:MAG: putative signal transducing protein [Actinomycetota bacterium]